MWLRGILVYIQAPWRAVASLAAYDERRVLLSDSCLFMERDQGTPSNWPHEEPKL